MKTKIENIEDYNIFTDENGNLTAELKMKSLRLSDIIDRQAGKEGWYLDIDGVKEEDLEQLEMNMVTEQIKESTARKAMLYGQILRIADYANVDWEKTKSDSGVSLAKNNNNNFVCSSTENPWEFGTAKFRTKELAQQAYDDNKTLFDEFFSL